MTALPFTRAATRVQAKRLVTSADLDWAQDWLHSHGVSASVLGGVLHIRGWDGLRLTARAGQWVCWEPTTGFFDVVDGDADGPVGHVMGAGE